MKENEIKISSIGEFINIINELSNTISENHKLFYRGQSSIYYKFESSIDRNPNVSEKKLYNKIIREYPYEFKTNNRLHNLTILQHFRAPTRLLDFSLNPLIALYFATCDNENIDGRIIILSVNENKIEFENSSKIRAIACLSYLNKKEIDMIRNLSNGVYKDKYLYEIKKVLFETDKQNLTSLDKALIYFINILKNENIQLNFKLRNLFNMYMLLSNKDFDRVKSQNGVFLLNGNDSRFNSLREISNDKYIYMEKYIIDVERKHKKKILQELNLIGINDSTVYPDLEKLCMHFMGKKASWQNYSK